MSHTLCRNVGYNPLRVPGQTSPIRVGQAQILYNRTPYPSRFPIPPSNTFPLGFQRTGPHLPTGFPPQIPTQSFRPPSVNVGRRIQPIALPSNIVRPLSYYNPSDSRLQRTFTILPRPIRPQTPPVSYNPLPSLTQIPLNPYLQAPPTPQVGQVPARNSARMYPQYFRPPFRGLMVPNAGNIG